MDFRTSRADSPLLDGWEKRNKNLIQMPISYQVFGTQVPQCTIQAGLHPCPSSIQTRQTVRRPNCGTSLCCQCRVKPHPENADFAHNSWPLPSHIIDDPDLMAAACRRAYPLWAASSPTPPGSNNKKPSGVHDDFSYPKSFLSANCLVAPKGQIVPCRWRPRSSALTFTTRHVVVSCCFSLLHPKET